VSPYPIVTSHLQLTVKALTKAKAQFQVNPLPKDAGYPEIAVEASKAAFGTLFVLFQETELQLTQGRCHNIFLRSLAQLVV
jgi:hypothetical protein